MRRLLLYSILAVLFAAVGCAKHRLSNKNCDNHYDITFLLHRYAKRGVFQQEKEFAMNLMNLFTIGENETRVAMILYNNFSSAWYTFRSFKQSLPLMLELTRKPLPQRGDSNIAGALNETYQLFRNETDRPPIMARSCFPKVAILLNIEGDSSPDPTLIGHWVKLLSQMKVTLFAIGIDYDKGDRKLLLEIAGDESRVLVTKKDQLQNIVHDVHEAIRKLPSSCSTSTSTQPTNTPTTTTTTTPTTSSIYKCTNDQDIHILVDCSAFIYYTEFRMELEFVEKFLSHLTIGPNRTRVALTRFSEKAYVDWTFTNTEQSLANLQNLTKELYWSWCIREEPIPASGLQQSVDLFRAESRKMDSTTYYPRVLLLISHGDGLWPSRLSAFTEMGVNFFAVGIGRYIKKLRLWEFTEDISRVFIANDTDKLELEGLDKHALRVAQAVCNLTTDYD